MGAWYVVGRTDSPEFPTYRAVQPNYNGNDGFLTRIVASAEARPQMSTYLGAGGCWGSPLGSDEAAAVAVDRSGPTDDRVYVAGTNVYESQVPWVTRIVGIISATPTIAYTACLHYSMDDGVRAALAIAGGGVVVAGEMGADDFLLVSPFQSALQGEQDTFIAKLSGAGVEYAALSFLNAPGNVRASGAPPGAMRLTPA